MGLLEYMGVNHPEELSNVIVWFFILTIVYGVVNTLLMIVLIANVDNVTKAIEKSRRLKDFDINIKD